MQKRMMFGGSHYVGKLQVIYLASIIIKIVTKMVFLRKSYFLTQKSHSKKKKKADVSFSLEVIAYMFSCIKFQRGDFTVNIKK